jgi:hypothetical protein
MQDFVQLVGQLESALDQVVDHGTDDELFIASYLQGHLALVAKPMEVVPGSNLEKLDSALTASLSDAYDNKELTDDDQVKVSALWSRLKRENA